MFVCPDCRGEIAEPGSPCTSCDWRPRAIHGLIDGLATRDRANAATGSLIETYEALAEHDWAYAGSAGEAYLDVLAERFADQIGDMASREVCDVGPGRGFFVKHAVARSALVSVVDIAEMPLQKIAEAYGIPCFLANAENLPFVEAFDVVAALGMLALVPNMANFLVTANWSLRLGGMLALQVPNRDRMLHLSRYHGFPWPFTSLRTFDRALLVALVEEAGFKVERVVLDGYRADFTAPWLARHPRLRQRLREWLLVRYGQFDANALPFRRLLLKPPQLNVFARKVEHLVPAKLYQSYAAVVEERRKRTARQAELVGGVNPMPPVA